MMHIKYRLDTSENHGIGLFADQVVLAGELIYSASPLLDLNITQKEFDPLHDSEKMKYVGEAFLIHQCKCGMLTLT